MSPRKKVNRSLRALRGKWLVLFVVFLLAISNFSILVTDTLGVGRAIWWGSVSTIVLTYQMLHLWTHLGLNLRSSTERLAATFGPGTQLSLVRLLCVSLLAGFVGLEKDLAAIAWAPFGLYLFANVADLFDGYVARLTRHQTPLGERLDVDLDGRGLLVASILVYQYGQVGWWFLLVGLARYVFVFGSWLRQRRGLRVQELKENLGRRALAGTQMGLTTALLAPVFSPPETTAAGTLFMIPFLANFAYDWLQVSGGAQGVNTIIKRLSGMTGIAKYWLPIFLRIIASAILFHRASFSPAFPALNLLNFLLSFALLTGTAGRVISVIVLIEIGFLSLLQPDWALLISCTALLFMGTGPFSIWKPEDYLIKRRLGER